MSEDFSVNQCKPYTYLSIAYSILNILYIVNVCNKITLFVEAENHSRGTQADVVLFALISLTTHAAPSAATSNNRKQLRNDNLMCAFVCEKALLMGTFVSYWIIFIRIELYLIISYYAGRCELSQISETVTI